MTFDYDMPEVKVEIIEDYPASNAPELESSIDAVEPVKKKIVEEDHSEMLEEDHRHDDSEEESQEADGTPAQTVRKYALRKRNKPIVDHTNSGNDSDDSDEDQGTTSKHVFSWKELYNPKRSRAAPPTRKILEYLPKPSLVPHTCYVCNTSYEDTEGLETHLEEHVGLVPYKCETCSTEQYPQEFKTLFTVNQHLQTHLYPYQCDYCPIRKLTMPTYEEHMRRYHGYQHQEDGFTCDYCGQHFTNKKTFKNHHAKHRALDEGRYKCEHCGRAFCSNTLLVRHRRIHTGEMPYECKKCGKKFNHKGNFSNHMRYHINEKGYVCTECGKSFISNTYLRYHMAEHFPNDPYYRRQPQKSVLRSLDADGKRKSSGEKVYECQFEGCDFISNKYSIFFHHKATHEQKFQCELCNRQFSLKHSLKRHIALVHEGWQPEKTLPCQYCDKLFNCKTKLRVHMDGHENIRRYKCGYCEKTFVQKNNLTEHERIHTGERPYPCRICPAAFITSSMRKKHERTHRAGGEGVHAETQEYQCETLEQVIEEQVIGYAAE